MRKIIRVSSERALVWTYLLAMLFGALMGALGGCAKEDRGATGTLTLHVSDAPYPFELLSSAEITIDKVEVRMLADDDTKSGFYVVADEPRTMNLLDLRGGVTEILAEAEVPVGQVDLIRLQVSHGRVTLVDGRGFDLTIPSGDASGLKLFPYPDVYVNGGMPTELLLDVDVSNSFASIPESADETAEIQGFKFDPSLRVANLSDTGALSGRVRGDAGTPSNPADDIVVADAGVKVEGVGTFRTSTDENGEWCLLGLPPGDYEVSAEAPGHRDSEVDAVVAIGSTVSGNDVVLHRE